MATTPGDKSFEIGRKGMQDQRIDAGVAQTQQRRDFALSRLEAAEADEPVLRLRRNGLVEAGVSCFLQQVAAALAVEPLGPHLPQRLEYLSGLRWICGLDQ